MLEVLLITFSENFTIKNIVDYIPLNKNIFKITAIPIVLKSSHNVFIVNVVVNFLFYLFIIHKKGFPVNFSYLLFAPRHFELYATILFEMIKK